MSYRILIGNDQAKEAYRENPEDKPKYREVEGQYVTTVAVPDGVGLAEAFTTVIEVVRHHMVEGGQPKWVEGDSLDLITMLKSYYGVSKARPKTWGKKN